MDYADFIASKSQVAGMHGFDPVWMPEFLFDFQRHLVEWACRKGKAAMNPIYLTGKQLESLMTGQIVSIEGPLNFSTKIVPPDTVKDTCHVSWSLHVATRDRMKEDYKIVSGSASSAWEEVDKLRERVAELEAALAQLRLNVGHNA